MDKVPGTSGSLGEGAGGTRKKVQTEYNNKTKSELNSLLNPGYYLECILFYRVYNMAKWRSCLVLQTN